LLSGKRGLSSAHIPPITALKTLREASHDLSQRHRLERNDAQFIQGLGISKAATLREATRTVTNWREAVERQRQELIALNGLITDAQMA
jgi:hypothetical protein